MASSKETYCLCGQPYITGQFMIECDCCREWFHGSCVDVKIYQSDDIDKYHCPKCAQIYGPSILKLATNNHRCDRYEVGAESRPAQAGSPAWVRALASRPLRPVAAALQVMHGQQFTEDFVKEGGFTKPILFHSPDGLDLQVPNATTFTVRSVLRYCGAQLEVEVIDVRRQCSVRMPLGDFVQYCETPPQLRGDKILNVLSLEFSNTNMSPLVEPPGVVRLLDWAERPWASLGSIAVRKYCIMSAGGSYTDWHVDFGGTSVWYHLMHGRKIFYLAPPTSANLALYQQWGSTNSTNERFFGDAVEWYGTCELVSGQSLFIPSGWIHAVYTPVDSLVFGGNYLHSYAIPLQLQIYEMERVVETPAMFRYPLLESITWLAAQNLLNVLKRYNEDDQDEEFVLGGVWQSPSLALPALLVSGLKAMATTLKEWHSLKASDNSKRENVPKSVNSGQLVRELNKELKLLDKRNERIKDRESKSRHSPMKSRKSQKKNQIKLTLPKPIMAHNDYENQQVIQTIHTIPPTHIYNTNGVETKSVLYQNNRFIPMEEDKVIYSIQDNNYEDISYWNGSKMKMKDPPPYGSILKAQLSQKPMAQWTISQKDEAMDQLLYTNDHIQYGPGMYSTEDLQQYPYQQYQEVNVEAQSASESKPRRSTRAIRRRVVPEFEYEIDEQSVRPKNGIDSLIQASEIADHATEDVAVAGMLSIGSRFTERTTFGIPNTTKSTGSSGGGTVRKRERARVNPALASSSSSTVRASSKEKDYLDEEDVIKEVHRDDEYVYPALDVSSSDSEQEWTQTKRKTTTKTNRTRDKGDGDAAWSPRVRVLGLTPRRANQRERGRDHVKAALRHARDKPTPKNHINRPRPTPSHPPPPQHNTNTRLKKGMKTAKQRLGKILKLHKMMY